ncbi:RNA polymerase sigma factor [Nibrella saemangeumensis]|uniref:RNA polymerase sigma factor n=1 Tax=Nibrella saemangeumensis TaxID=1084526 RepID=A0ABP8N739_9BACT
MKYTSPASNLQPASSNETYSFEKLYNTYVKQVYRQCLSFTKDSSQAQDFTHDIFLKIFTGLPNFQYRSALSTWLFAVTRNHCIDQLHAAHRSALSSLTEEVDCPEPESEEEYFTRLQQLLNELPLSEVQLLRCKYEEKQSIKEIADRLGLKESAVKMRLKRAKAKVLALYLQKNQ